MVWFKVDDGFYDNPKVAGISNAAVGLWAKAGSFCAKHLTDGVITAQQVRALKGTEAQISALIRAGLWVETECDLGVKAYSFRNWFEYQPTRDSVEESRREWSEKKRKSRERKRAEQQERGNVPGGVTRESPKGTFEGVTEMSGTIPDPTRPDPSLSMVTVSKQATSSTARDEWAAAKNIPTELHSAASRALANGHPEQAILLAAQEWQTRPGHKTPGLLAPLIRDAETRLESEAGQQRKHDQAQARRDAITNCDMCDPNGYILGLDDAVRCRHDYTANDALMRHLELGEQPEAVKGPF